MHYYTPLREPGQAESGKISPLFAEEQTTARFGLGTEALARVGKDGLSVAESAERGEVEPVKPGEQLFGDPCQTGTASKAGLK